MDSLSDKDIAMNEKIRQQQATGILHELEES